MGTSLKDRYASSPLFGSNASAVEAMYEQFLADADSVPEAWRRYFESLGDPDTEIVHSTIRQGLLESARDGGRARTVAQSRRGPAASTPEKQAAVARLIQVLSLIHI